MCPVGCGMNQGQGHCYAKPPTNEVAAFIFQILGRYSSYVFCFILYHFKFILILFLINFQCILIYCYFNSF